ncbi:MAG TPA: hypothetical protein PK335_01580 [Draconibacterium sp.]|nr:hypothetical protein [Draconibacterium sp.]
MKSFNRAIVYFSAFTLFGIFYSCKDDISYHYFMIEIDEIIAPDTLTLNEPFDIYMKGLIGVNGCYQFSEFKTLEKENELVIEAWGKINKISTICTDQMVYLDNEPLNYHIKESGIFSIKVKQPTGSYIEKKVFVE